MKTLIVEDDFTSRFLLQEILHKYGPAHVSVNGREAVDAVRAALEAGQPYDLICLDIMMPEMDGHTALQLIREAEAERGIFSTDGARVIMTTALDDLHTVAAAFNQLCDAYLVKPIDRGKLIEHIGRLGLQVA